MFDLAWSEIALIGVVALVVIGPKDLPEAIRGVAKGVQKLRRMAAEFQTHADELVREAKLDEVRNQINEVKSAVSEIRNFDLRGEMEKAVDSDGALRKTFDSQPFAPAPEWTPPAVTEPDPALMEGGRAGMPEAAPAFIPPAEAARVLPAAPAAEPAPLAPAGEPAPNAPPAFVPPGAVAEAAPQPAPSAQQAAPQTVSPAQQATPQPELAAQQAAPPPAPQNQPAAPRVAPATEKA